MRIIAPLLIFLSLFFILEFQIIDTACAQSAKSTFLNGLQKTAEGTGHQEAGGQIGQTAPEIVGKIIKAFLSLLGVIFVLLMIYGGYLWFMSRGNDSEVKKAQDVIRNAVIGVMIVLAAYAITNFISGTLIKSIAQ